MLRPGPLIFVLAAALFVYTGFIAAPDGARLAGNFDPDRVAADEASVWQAVKADQEFAAYADVVELMRDENRYTWFRACQSAFYLTRAMTTFTDLHSHFEQVLPDLEAAASIERDWRGASFSPASVARAELDWWVTRQMPNLNTVDSVAALMATEYSLRYRIDPSRVAAAATLRAEAAALRDQGGADPDWPAITRRLADSYRSLRSAIEQARATHRLGL